MIAAGTRAPARPTRVARERAATRAPGTETLADLPPPAAPCTRCPLHGPATQVVMGEGPLNAPIFFVGEQPGDREDLAGRPFVGPAGQLFDRALADAGIPRSATFVTNAVKHFKFEPRGKRRIHRKPTVSEIDRCRVWLDRERRLVSPRLTVALGATAARALGGKSVAIADVRGEILTWPDGSPGFATVHPSFLLRLRDDAERAREYERFVRDLARISRAVQTVSGEREPGSSQARHTPAQ